MDEYKDMPALDAGLLAAGGPSSITKSAATHFALWRRRTAGGYVSNSFWFEPDALPRKSPNDLDRMRRAPPSQKF
jgi:hypothetical protein